MEFGLPGRHRTFAGILLFGLLAMTARNAIDPDLWWHLRTGEWIVQMGQIPHVDPFSFTRAGATWVSHEWLSEVIFFLLWKYGGTAALIVFSAVITTAGFMLLYFRCPGKPAAAALAVAIGALASAPAWGVRPQMFTFALASLMLWLLERGEHHSFTLLWIPPLFLVWLNLHAGFALGPALLLMVALGILWETATGQSRWQHVRRYFVHVVLAFVVCMVLVPLNPSGTELYRYPLEVLRSPGMRAFIVEWHPPDFHEWRYAPVLLLWLAILIAFAVARSRPKARIIAPLLLTFAGAMDAVRHIPIFVLVAAPILAAAIPLSLQVEDVRIERRPGQHRVAFRVAVVILMAVFAILRWATLVGEQTKIEAELAPRRAVEFLRTREPVGRNTESLSAAGRAEQEPPPIPRRLFVYYDWGGYAIWKLYPQYQVFVDGRADLYGDELLHNFQEIIQLRPAWKELLDSWKVEAVLVPRTTAISQALLLDARWHVEFQSAEAIVFVRNATIRPHS